MIKVDVLDKWSDFCAFLNLLASHDLGDLSWVFSDTGDESVAEFSFLVVFASI